VKRAMLSLQQRITAAGAILSIGAVHKLRNAIRGRGFDFVFRRGKGVDIVVNKH
jgi:hypothetical protein